MLEDIVKQNILDYIREYGSATYSEIEEVMTAAGFKWEGTLYICSDQNTNVVFWAGWNKAALSLIRKMIKSGTISREPCHFFNYLVSGKYLTLPLVKKNTAYKTEHWLPCLFVRAG